MSAPKHKEPATATKLAAWLATIRAVTAARVEDTPNPWYIARDAEEIVACGRALRRIYERMCSEPMTDKQEAALERRERRLRNRAMHRLDTALGAGGSDRPNPFRLVFNRDPRGPAIRIYRSGDDPLAGNAVFIVDV